MLIFPIPLSGSRYALVATPRFFGQPAMRCEFSSANTNHRFVHRLERVPEAYFVIGRDAGFVVYDGSDPSTKTEIVLRSTATGVAQIVVL